MLTENYWKGILINSPVHFELGDINTLAEYLTEVSNGAKPAVSGALSPSPYIELGVEAREYAKKIGELENGILELSFYNGGVFVINEWLGGNDR